MRAAQQRDQIVGQAVEIETRAFILGHLLLACRLRLRRNIGRRRLGRLPGRRLDRGGLDAELVELLPHRLGEEIAVTAKPMVVLEVPIGGPGLAAALAVDRAFIIAELGEAGLHMGDGFDLFGRRRFLCGRAGADGLSLSIGLRGKDRGNALRDAVPRALGIGRRRQRRRTGSDHNQPENQATNGSQSPRHGTPRRSAASA